MAMTFKQASIGEQYNTIEYKANNKSLVRRSEKKKQKNCVVQNKEVIELAQSASQPAYIPLYILTTQSSE